MNDERTQDTHTEADDRNDAPAFELQDVEDVSEIQFERGALTDINYGF